MTDKLILYTGVGDKFIEAYNSMSIMSHRILCYLGVDYILKMSSFPENFQKIKKSLATFPIISYERQIYHHYTDMQELFTKLNPEKLLISPQYPQPAMQVLLYQWANDSVSYMSKYFVGCVEKNWERFYEAMKKDVNSKKILEGVIQMKKHNVSIVKNSTLNRYDYDGMKFLLHEQFNVIEQILGKNLFLCGDKPNIADMRLFSELHLLFHPFIPETNGLDDKFPKLIDWLKRVDKNSSGRFTKKINI